MKTILCLVFVLFGSVSFAQTPADDSIAGNWINDSYDGVYTQLEVSDNGKFVYRQQHSNDLRRAYMCGKLTDEGDTLRLQVENYKERLINGEIVQATGTQEKTFTVKSRTARSLVVTVGSQTVVLNLT